MAASTTRSNSIRRLVEAGLKRELLEQVMSIRKLMLCFFACAMVVPASSAALAAKSAADQQLYEKARKACSGRQYINGARPHINYAGGWFRCVEPRLKKHGRRG